MDESKPLGRYQVSIRSLMLVVACFAVVLVILPAVWNYSTIPRPRLGMAATTPLVDTIDLDVEVFACSITELERLGVKTNWDDSVPDAGCSGGQQTVSRCPQRITLEELEGHRVSNHHHALRGASGLHANSQQLIRHRCKVSD